MRISNASLHQRVLKNLQSNLVRLARAQDKATTGLRVSRPSDDPVATTRILRGDSQLQAIAQHRRNVTAVRTRLDTQEAVLDQVTDILGRAKELGMVGGSSNSTPEGRRAMGLEVGRLLEQVVALGNTRIGDEFVFGGTATGSPPFQPDGTYVGNTGVRRTELQPGQVVEFGHHGQELLVDTGVIATLTSLRDQLLGNDPDAVRTTLTTLDTSFGQVQGFIGDVGARVRQLDVTLQNLEALDAGETIRRSALMDVPLEEAAMELAGVQTSLQAAMLATSRLLQTSLTEYLR